MNTFTYIFMYLCNKSLILQTDNNWIYIINLIILNKILLY